VKRINIIYGGEQYTIADADPEVIKADITQAITSGSPFWLRVNHGEGTVRAADLLITAGTAISLMGIEPSGPTDTPNSSVALAVGPSDASSSSEMPLDEHNRLGHAGAFDATDAR
jgi:hypothetical protein